MKIIFTALFSGKAFGLARLMFCSALLAVCALTACSAPSPADGSLAKGWTYAPAGRDERPADIKNRVFRSVPDITALEKLFPSSEDGYLWLKNEFSLPARLKGKSCAILLGRVRIADESYLNGELLGRAGRFPPDFFSEWNRYRFYPVRQDALREDTPNTLMVKVYVHSEGAVSGRILIDERDSIERIFIFEDFMNSSINAGIAFLILMIACYHAFLFIKRPVEKENIYYALVCLAFSLYLSNQFLTRLPGFGGFPFSYLAYQKFIFSASFFIAFMNVLFVREFLRRGERPWLRVFSAAIFAIPVLAIAFAPDYRSFMALRNPLSVFLFLQAAYTVYMLVHSCVKKVPEARILLAGTAPLLLCIVYDIVVHEVLRLHDTIFMAGLGFPAYLIAVAVILADRFVNHHNEVEHLNISLGGKVEERTLKLRESNESLEGAKTALESANTRLTEANERLEEAQRIARRDMRMTTYVLRGLVPQSPPQSDDWDVAFVFSPMSGISGDIYGFYTDDGRLTGAYLYDISGHGIASGLITMIAKTATSRHFTSNPETKLTKIADCINRDLAGELMGTGDYASGILLRFDGGSVEYVNAGHPDLLVRKAGSGLVKAATVRGRDTRGLFLGIKSEDAAYSGLSFRVGEGDALLVYSDCLNESVNGAGEQYGIDRIAGSLSGAPGESAREILDHVVGEFNAFTGGRPPCDDLSVILLRRKA